MLHHDENETKWAIIDAIYTSRVSQRPRNRSLLARARVLTLRDIARRAPVY